MCLNSTFFVIARDRRIPPPSQAGVGFGLWLGSPVWFCRSIGQHEIKLRRHQGPTAGGVLPPIHTRHTNVHTPIHNGPLVLARLGSTTMIAAIQSTHQRILVLTQKGHNTSVMHTFTHPPIAHLETRLRHFTSTTTLATGLGLFGHA